MKPRVCGTVILYHPNTEVLDNIQSYLGQVELLIVVDNSETIDPNIIDKIKAFDKIKYISQGENLGVATALNIAAKIAIENDFHYLITMDQDSKAPFNMVSSLLKVAQSDSNAGIISPLHSNRYETHLKFPDGVQKVTIAMTSGNLLSLEAYKKLGPFCEEFFIDYVDIEYCLRMYINNYNILQLKDVVLDHNEADLFEINLFGKKVHPHNHKPFRLYYKTRNLLYLRKKYKNVIPHLLKIEYKSYFMTIVRMVAFEKSKFLKLKMVFMGVWDYFKEKKGRRF